jgi:hypothetical protein
LLEDCFSSAVISTGVSLFAQPTMESATVNVRPATWREKRFSIFLDPPQASTRAMVTPTTVPARLSFHGAKPLSRDSARAVRSAVLLWVYRPCHGTLPHRCCCLAGTTSVARTRLAKLSGPAAHRPWDLAPDCVWATERARSGGAWSCTKSRSASPSANGITEGPLVSSHQYYTGVLHRRCSAKQLPNSSLNPTAILTGRLVLAGPASLASFARLPGAGGLPTGRAYDYCTGRGLNSSR